MADTKISALTEVTAPATTDVVPVVSGGATKKLSIANLVAANLGTGATQAAAGNHTHASSTPADVSAAARIQSLSLFR